MELEVGSEWYLFYQCAYSTSTFLGLSTSSSVQQRHKAFKAIWWSYAPRRAQAIAWKTLHQRLPMKDNLKAKNIIPADGNSVCVLCGSHKENNQHILFECQFENQIWIEFFQWLKCSTVAPAPLADHLSHFYNLINDGKFKRLAATVWTCIVWMIWNCRNEVILNNSSFNVRKVIDKINRVSS